MASVDSNTGHRREERSILATFMTSDRKDIEQVRSGEQRRSKRLIDIEERRRSALLKRKFLEAIQSGDRDAFIEAIVRDLGQLPGTPEYEESLRMWDEYYGNAS